MISSSPRGCLIANGNAEVRGETSHDSKVSECDNDAMYQSLMDHFRSLDIMLDKDSDKIKDLSKIRILPCLPAYVGRRPVVKKSWSSTPSDEEMKQVKALLDRLEDCKKEDEVNVIGVVRRF